MDDACAGCCCGLRSESRWSDLTGAAVIIALSRSPSSLGIPRLLAANCGDEYFLLNDVTVGEADCCGSSNGGGNSGTAAVDAAAAASAQQQSSANTDELTVVAVDEPSSLQLLHDVRMDAIGAATEDDGDFWRWCCCCWWRWWSCDGGLRNRSDADGNNCSVCLGTSEKLSWLPPLGDMHGVGWITCKYVRRFDYHNCYW